MTDTDQPEQLCPRCGQPVDPERQVIVQKPGEPMQHFNCQRAEPEKLSGFPPTETRSDPRQKGAI